MAFNFSNFKENGAAIEGRFREKIDFKGIRIIGNDNSLIRKWNQKLEQSIGSSNEGYQFDKQTLQVRLFISNSEIELKTHWPNCVSSTDEINVFLVDNPEASSFVDFGTKFQSDFSKYKDYGSFENPIKKNKFNSFEHTNVINTGNFEGKKRVDFIFSFAQIGYLINNIIAPVSTLIDSLKNFNPYNLISDYLDDLMPPLIQKVRQTINEPNENPENPENQITFFSEAEGILENLKGLGFNWLFGNIYFVSDCLEFLEDSIKNQLEDSFIYKFHQAKGKFDEGVISSLTDMDKLEDTLKAFFKDFQANQQQIQEMAIGGAILGSTSFVVGTIYQIIYDLVNTFVQLIKYSLAFVAYVGNEIKASVVGNSQIKEHHPYSEDVIFGFFPKIDINKFMEEDLPELWGGMKVFLLDLVDNFMENAFDYGQALGDFLLHIGKNSVSGVLKIAFAPYDNKASFLDKLWYMVKSYFNIGTVLGPILVDLILLVCSGGTLGIVSAGAKFGKIAKVGKLFRFAQKSGESLKNVKIFKIINDLIPNSLKKLLTRLLDEVWQAIGSAWDAIKSLKDRVIDYFNFAYSKLDNTNDLPDIEKLAKTIDNLYDAASGINFIISLHLLLFGGTIDNEGELILAE